MIPLAQGRILVVDDDREIVKLICLYLENEGYETLTAYNGRECLERIGAEKVDLLVLDIMMPELDGMEACRRIRETQNIPIIFVSAKGEPMDKIMGLATGADDYLTKPFHPMELVARIKAQLRRFHQFGTDSREENKGQIVLKDLIINPAEHTVQRDGEFIAFTPKEFEILLLLAQNPNMVFSSEAIFERVWGLDSLGQDNTVMVHIRRIRSKLGDMPRESKYIHTVWGVGYKVEK